MKTEPEESEGPAEKPGLIFGSSDNDNDNDNQGGSAVLGDNKEENIGEQFQ